MAPLLVAGAFCVGWRVITAGVVGANIGGGVLLVAGGPVVLILAGVAVLQAVASPAATAWDERLTTSPARRCIAADSLA